MYWLRTEDHVDLFNFRGGTTEYLYHFDGIVFHQRDNIRWLIFPYQKIPVDLRVIDMFVVGDLVDGKRAAILIVDCPPLYAGQHEIALYFCSLPCARA